VTRGSSQRNSPSGFNADNAHSSLVSPPADCQTNRCAALRWAYWGSDSRLRIRLDRTVRPRACPPDSFHLPRTLTTTTTFTDPNPNPRTFITRQHTLRVDHGDQWMNEFVSRRKRVMSANTSIQWPFYVRQGANDPPNLSLAPKCFGYSSSTPCYGVMC